MILFFLTTLCYSSHFRYGQITWRRIPGGNGRLIQLEVEVAYRAAYFSVYDDSSIGDPFHDGFIRFDNSIHASEIYVVFSVTSVNPQEDWLIGRAIYQYEYPADGTYVVTTWHCCRIGTIKNNPFRSFRYNSVVKVIKNQDTQSMKASFIPIQHIRSNALSEFRIPVIPGTHPVIRYRISGNEAVETGTYQPIEGLSIDPVSGIMSWTPQTNGLYTNQITINGFPDEAAADAGIPSSSIAVDFLINVVSDTGNVCKSTCGNPGAICLSDDDCNCDNSNPILTPFCITNVPPVFSSIEHDGTVHQVGSNVVLTMSYGVSTRLEVFATDSNEGDTVFISSTTPPPSSTVSKQNGNPASIAIEWTPDGIDNGISICFTASDSYGLASQGQLCITFNLLSGILRAEGEGLTRAVAGRSTQVSIFNAQDRSHELIITGNELTVSASIVDGPMNTNGEYEYYATYNGVTKDLTLAGFYQLQIIDTSSGVQTDAPLTFFLEVVPAETDPLNADIFDSGGSIGLQGGKSGESVFFFIQSRDEFGNLIQEERSDTYFVEIVDGVVGGNGSSPPRVDFTAIYVDLGMFTLNYTVPSNSGIGDTAFSLKVYHEDASTSVTTFIRDFDNLLASSEGFEAILTIQDFYIAGEVITADILLLPDTIPQTELYITLLDSTSLADFVENNAYSFTGVPITKAGRYANGISLNSPGIRSVIRKDVFVVPGPPNATNSLAEYEEAEFDAGETMTVSVVLYDTFDNRIYDSNHEIEYAFKVDNVTVTGSGEFQASTSKFIFSFSSTLIGSGSLEIVLKGFGDLITGSAIPIRVGPGPFSFSKSLISRPSSITAGEPFLVTIDAFDNYNNRREARSDLFDFSFTALSSSSGNVVETSASLYADKKVSRYTLVLMTTLAGYSQVSLHVSVSGSNSEQSPTFQFLTSFLVLVSENTLNLSKSIALGRGLEGGDALDTASILIQTSDRFGNAIRSRIDHVFILLIEYGNKTEVHLANYSEPTSVGFCGLDSSLTFNSLEKQILSANSFWSFEYQIPLLSRIGPSNYSITLIYTTSDQLNRTLLESSQVPENSTLFLTTTALSTSYARGRGSSDFFYYALSVFFGLMLCPLIGYSGWRMYRYREKYKIEKLKAASAENILDQLTSEAFIFKNHVDVVGAAKISKNPLHPINKNINMI